MLIISEWSLLSVKSERGRINSEPGYLDDLRNALGIQPPHAAGQHRAAESPPMAAATVKSLQRGRNRGYLVANGVAVEPVSSDEFPTNREKNREFARVTQNRTNLSGNSRVTSNTWSKIPYAQMQGT